MPKKVIKFSPSSLNNLQACAYKHYLGVELGLMAPEKGENLEEGDLIHRLYESYNIQRRADPNLVLSTEDYNRAVEKAIESTEEYSASMGLLPEEIDTVIYQFKEHSKFHRFNGEKVLEVEQPFLVKMHEDEELGIYLEGKIDVIVEFPNFGICVKDYKKVQQAKYPSPLMNQFTAYSAVTELPYVLVDTIGFQKSYEPEKRFKYYPLYYTKYMIEEWWNDTIWWGKMYAYHLEEWTWPRNRTSCDKYGGCLFGPICNAYSEEGAKAVINSAYVKKEKFLLFTEKDVKDEEDS